MAIQAQLYSDNIGFPLCNSYDYNGGNGNDGFNSFHFGPQWKPQLQFQEQLQNHEIDEFIKSQDERLRLLLQEQRSQQVSTMVKKLESKASFLEEEITKAKNRTMELQILMNKLEMENQTWQRVAQENEAMVVSLNNMLQQLQQQLDNGVDDAGSCCEETEENRGFGVVERTMMVCKCCDSRNSCVLFLPCRHLCTYQWRLYPKNIAPAERGGSASAGNTIVSASGCNLDCRVFKCCTNANVTVHYSQ